MAEKYREIVINREHGGFGLSPKAAARYYKRKGAKVKLYHDSTRISLKEADELHRKGEIILFKVTYPGKKEVTYVDHDHIDRDDPDLVAVVKALGSAKASDCLASLKIVKVPIDVDWEVQEYDGMEWVAERHRTWG